MNSACLTSSNYTTERRTDATERRVSGACVISEEGDSGAALGAFNVTVLAPLNRSAREDACGIDAVPPKLDDSVGASGGTTEAESSLARCNGPIDLGLEYRVPLGFRV